MNGIVDTLGCSITFLAVKVGRVAHKESRVALGGGELVMLLDRDVFLGPLQTVLRFRDNDGLGDA